MLIKKIRIKILEEAKQHIIKYGWNDIVFKKIKKNSEFNLKEIKLLFPNGHKQLLQLYLDELNKKMKIESKKVNFLRLKIHERIKELIKIRLVIMSKEKILISRTFFYMLLPHNYKFSLKNIYKTVDEIWFISGDSSTDFNYYTKRAILASVYTSTIIHFINNENFNETLNFLNQQLKRVSKIPKIKEKFKDLINITPKIFNISKIFSSFKQ